MTLPSEARTRSRSGIASLLVATLLLLGTGIVAVAVVHHFHYPKTSAVTLTLDPQCSSNGLVRVAGHEWFGAGTAAKWPRTVHGAFKIVSSHHATFTADVGGNESFTLLPKGQSWAMSCPVGVRP